MAFLSIQVTAQKPLRFSEPNNTNGNNAYVSYSKDKTSIKPRIIAFDKKGIYTRKDKFIGYTLRLENNLRQDQNGEIALKVVNQSGVVLHQDVASFNMRKKGEFEKNYFFDGKQIQPGYYTSTMFISSAQYADTISYTFAFEPNTATALVSNAPSDFVNFWDQAKRELYNTRADIAIRPRPDLFRKHYNTFEVEFQSTDKAIIYGWLTVPANKSPQPVLYIISDYQGELIPEYRKDVAVLSINTRGTGASNQHYNFGYDQLGLYNVSDKNRSYLKGAYLDGLRGLDVIMQAANANFLDTRKIVVQGAGLGAGIAACIGAIDSRVIGIVMEAPSFIGFNNLLNSNSQGFPAYMFNNYIAQRKSTRENLINNLEYFDPIYFAPYISSRILVGFSSNNSNTPAQNVLQFINQLRVHKKEKYECKNCGNSLNKRFYGFKETWLKERFGQP
ncbi:MAG: acetylxylan esterase [Chitinophagaceae bacterium]|nr:acetylxylan esterase [Chitinophagaceae bacterium]